MRHQGVPRGSGVLHSAGLLRQNWTSSGRELSDNATPGSGRAALLPRGAPVDPTPAVGAIAWWTANANPYIGASGHVAYVEKVNSDGSVVVSEDNFGGDFDWRQYDPGTYFPTGFIHVADVHASSSRRTSAPSRPAVVSDGYMWVHATGSDGRIYYRYRNESTNTWRTGWGTLSKPTGVTLKIRSRSARLGDGHHARRRGMRGSRKPMVAW